MLRHFLTSILMGTGFFAWTAAQGTETVPLSTEQAKRISALSTSAITVRACILLPLNSGKDRSNHVLLYPCGQLKDVDANPEQHVMLAEIMSEAAIQPFLNADISIDNTREVQADFMGELGTFQEKSGSPAEVLLKIRSVSSPHWYNPYQATSQR